MHLLRVTGSAAIAAVTFCLSLSAQTTVLVLDNVRLFAGTGGPVVPDARIVVEGNRIVSAGPGASVPVPGGANRIDLRGATVLPGLIDLHYHIEKDPKLALRQLANGVTSFRDPGAWFEPFEPLKRMIADERLPGPRLFLCGPHIDGDHPAYPHDAVVARDPEEARQFAERSIAQGANAIKIYFRLSLASARAVIDVCRARGVACTAHLEILDARELLRAGLHGVEHITSFGTAIVPQRRAEQYRQAVLADNGARRDGRYQLFAEADLDGPEARELYKTIEETRPFVDPTLAVFEAQAGDKPPTGSALTAETRARGFEAMQQLAVRLHRHGARLVVGGHTEVPHAGRGEAPWRELELLVDAGLTPTEALTAATANAAAFLGRTDLGTIAPGRLADLIVVDGDPTTDISQIRRVSRVMVDGIWIERDRYRDY